MLKQPELENLRKRLLQTALEFYREMATTLTNSPEYTLEARDELAQAYSAVAGIMEQVGSKEDALAAFQKVRAIVEELRLAKPDDDALRVRLARCLRAIAQLSASTGRRADAARAHSEVLALRRGLLENHPDDASIMQEIAWDVQSIGTFHQEDGQRELAMQSYREALVYHETIVRLRPDDVVNESRRAGVLHDIALLEGRTNWEDGVRSMQIVIDIRRRIVGRHPDDDGYKKMLAMSCNDLGASSGGCCVLTRLLVSIRRPSLCMKT